MPTALSFLGLHVAVVVLLAAVARAPVSRAPVAPGLRFRVLVAILGGVVGLVVATLAGVGAGVTAWATAKGVGSEVATTAGTLVLFLGPVPVTALVAFLSVPGRDAVHVRTWRFVTSYTIVVGPALLVVALMPAIPSGWGLVIGAALLGIVVAGGAPLILLRTFPTRRLSSAERARFTAATDFPVRVVDTDGQHANALAAGVLPGLRYVVVTERLLTALPADEVAAILAHESGHHHRCHTPLRLGVVAGFVLPWLWATAASVPGAFSLGAVAALPVAGGVLTLARWTEYDADRYAAERVGASTLASALRRLSGARLLAGRGGLLALHPATDDRLTRLERERGTARNVSGNDR